MLKRTNHLHVELPWPSRALSPNARVHWAVKRKATQAAKQYASAQTLHNLQGKNLPKTIRRISYRLTFLPPDRRARDEDNLVAQMKAYLDGVAIALDIDDRNFHLLEPRVGAPAKPGRVMIDFYFD